MEAILTLSWNEDPIARRLFEALDALRQGRTEPWSEMFSASGRMEFPYAPPGYPGVVEGKAAIADYIRSYPDRIALREITADNVLRTGDTRIVEFHAAATAVTTGRDFVMHYVAIIEVVNDRIETYRDYWNPLIALEAMGGLETMNRLGQADE